MKPIILPSATGVGSPLRIEVREDVGVAWIESWSTESSNRAWANPKLDDLIEALGAVRKPRTVTTAAELDALPVGSVVLLDGDAHQKREGVFWGTDGGWLTSRQAAKSAPITVLNEPTP